MNKKPGVKGDYLVTEILLKTNKGMVFEKTTENNRCKVSVIDESDVTHMVYYYNKINDPFKSQYISWENLNCCGGWECDESYLLNAVQESKKLCSGITFHSENDLNNYMKNLSNDYYYNCPPPMRNGPYTSYYIDIIRKGSLNDYFNQTDFFNTYIALGITDSQVNFKLLQDMFDVPMHFFISGETFDYNQPKRPEEFILTGLILGYPLESTAWLLENHKLPRTKYGDN